MPIRTRAFRRRTACLILWLGLATPCLPAFAEDGFTLNTGNNIRMLLVHQRGTTVTLQLASGKELTGTISVVGEHLVQLSRLSGREYFDAAVSLDQIEAVIIRARSK